ncbi:FG-GAP repeat domain-containing protein [Streptomyces sp. NPDC088729]|uniref:FG-GAP repeat domain-containing protein n=1 Tax=Streptomyces sp. NPDC088729 TaxID=3365876 RepID=UPI003808D305
MSSYRFRTASAVLVALGVTVAGVPLALSATAAPAAPAGPLQQRVDFNGDGYEDMVASVPEGTVSGVKKAGYLAVYLGDAKGISPSRHQIISRKTPNVPGEPQAGGLFGGGTTADVDGDGFTDMLVRAGVGAPVLLFGGSAGLGTRAAEFAGRGSAVGDYDGDGRAEVAGVGAGGTTVVLSGDIGADGSVGSTRTALTEDSGYGYYRGVQAVDMNSDGKDDLLVSSGCDDEPDCGGMSLYLSDGATFTYVPFKTAAGTLLEHSTVTVGSVNGDAYPDLVHTRRPTGMDSDVDFPSKGGALAVVYGGPQGQNTALTTKWITQDAAGVPGADEVGDRLGESTAVRDLDGDGYGEVVVGLPGEDVGEAPDAGGVLVFKGRSGGITGADTKVIGQSTADIPGVDEKGDGFGGEVHVVAGAKGVPATLAIGAPGENAGHGGVWLLKGGPSGPLAPGSVSFGEQTLGLTPSPVRFGGILD